MIKGSRIVVFLGVAFTALTLRADIVVDMGASSQDLVLTGLGSFGGYGYWAIQQGSCTSAGTVTCNLSGSIVPGGSSGFTSGTYDLTTTFAATDFPYPVQGVSAGPDPGPDANYFYYSYLASDVSMVLQLDTPSGDYAVPIVTNGFFDDIQGLFFAYTGTEVCTGGVSPCDQAAVALVNGAAISGPVNMSAEFPNPTPEPGLFGLLGLCLCGLVVVAVRRTKTQA
jgi:hypothetical protein